MKARCWYSMNYAFVLCLACVIPAATAQQNSTEQKAKEILDGSGVKGGLIVHIGCDDGKLTAALGADDRYIVHGLDEDAGDVERSRRLIASRGLCGRVSVDRFDGRRLPYIDNLAHIVVAEDRGDVPVAEVMLLSMEIWTDQ